MASDEKYLSLCHYESDDMGNGEPVEIMVSFCDDDNNHYSYRQTVNLRTTGNRIIADHSLLTRSFEKTCKELSSIKKL